MPLVYDDSQSMSGNVENTTGLAMVGLVRHTLLHSPISFDVHDVSNFVHLHIRGKRDDSTFPEFSGKQVPGSSPVPFGVSHFSKTGECMRLEMPGHF